MKVFVVIREYNGMLDEEGALVFTDKDAAENHHRKAMAAIGFRWDDDAQLFEDDYGNQVDHGIEGHWCHLIEARLVGELKKQKRRKM